MKTVSKLWVGIVFLILLCPLGLLVPEKFRSGAAWGEWGMEEIKEMVGYIPSGLNALSGVWKAPFPDYTFRGWEDKGWGHSCFSYVISAVVGIAVIVVFVFIFGKFLGKKNK
ncbi:MAG: PDGLE domain-containing protein [Candidatus Omnitrophica bacterium]|nr:PDGLE domain-containing protein [Candidatus Omnitrophota bacterium]